MRKMLLRLGFLFDVLGFVVLATIATVMVFLPRGVRFVDMTLVEISRGFWAGTAAMAILVGMGIFVGRSIRLILSMRSREDLYQGDANRSVRQVLGAGYLLVGGIGLQVAYWLHYFA